MSIVNNWIFTLMAPIAVGSGAIALVPGTAIAAVPAFQDESEFEAVGSLQHALSR